MGRVFVAGAVIFILSFWTASASAIASASSGVCGDPAVYQLVRETKGPYEISVGVLPAKPTVGSLRLMVSVCDAMTGQPIGDAQVFLVPESPDGRVGAPIYALNRYTGPEEYSADISVKEAGLWRYQVQIKDGGNEVALEVPVEILEPPGYGGATTVVFLATVALLISGGLYLFGSARR